MNLVESLSKSSWIAGFKTVPCNRDKCRRWLTQRALDTRHVGITLEGKWYCSYRCVASAVEELIIRLLGSSSRRNGNSPRMPLGLMLVSRGYITEMDLKRANEELRRKGGELGEILVQMGVISERQILSTRASQWGCPLFTPTAESQHVSVKLPPTLLRRSGMVPLHYSATGKKLLMGFVDSIEYGALYAMEQVLGCKTHPCFITRAELDALMALHEERAATQEICFDDLVGTTEMTRVLCNQGIAISADQLSITRSRGYVWGRFTAANRSLDVLIRVGESAPALLAIA
ncbi:Type II secretion system (T2SS), protein E, N-terminal domain [Bryocella elongata]|uniref:Type II secretion system (T2SS), protein E, N-terminal domain n=1 Tax=Bryocella elongata TaxID=863522 RepID=A0A1H5TM04_9BACT|nr:hypothetical protein [Bryocella elongata]SEF63057.1 Type II secretion system (T2SS), protein E, N-terminal domain [Bryocella elongata]